MSTTTETIEYRGFTLDVTFNYDKGCRGARDSFNGRPGAGAQLEPDEPESIEIEKVELEVNRYPGEDVKVDITELLTELQFSEIEAILWEKKATVHEPDYDE